MIYFLLIPGLRISMKVFLYLLPYLYSVLLFVGFNIASSFTYYLWYVLAFLSLTLLLVWFGIVQIRNFSKEQVVIFLSPLLYLLSSYAFFLLADSPLLKRFLIALVIIGLFVILRALYFFYWKSVKYQPLSLQIHVRYLNTISLFFLASFLYSLETFLNISLWLNALLIVVFLLWSSWQINYLQRVTSGEKLLSFIFVLLMAELFVAIGFLPFLVLVKGFIFFIMYFIFNELYQYSQKGIWEKKKVFWLFMGGFFLLAIIFFTTKWF